MLITYSRCDSPLGTLTVAVANTTLHGLAFEGHWEQLQRHLERCLGRVTFEEAPAPQPIRQALEAYFAGDLDALDGLVVDPPGTPFQRQVWDALRRVPVGSTVSYQALAQAAGCPGAARAVGMANAQNPVAVVVPCHRVIRADGSLSGYGGGVDRKEWLLRHEHAWPPPAVQA